LYEQTIQTKSLIFLLASGGQCQKGSRTVFKQQLTALALGSFLADVGSRAPTTLQGEVSIGTPSHLAQLLACAFFNGQIDTQVIEALVGPART
jgi:hypothetical protein